VVYMTVVSLVATSASVDSAPDSTMIHDVIWAFATPETGLEHVRVARDLTQIHIAMFCLAPTEDMARSAAVTTCERACRNSPLLAGWEILR
jgi:hypothetical protein